VARIVLETVHDTLLRVVLQTARDDHETRRERQRDGIEIAGRAGRFTRAEVSSQSVKPYIVSEREPAGAAHPDGLRLRLRE